MSKKKQTPDPGDEGLDWEAAMKRVGELTRRSLQVLWPGGQVRFAGEA